MLYDHQSLSICLDFKIMHYFCSCTTYINTQPLSLPLASDVKMMKFILVALSASLLIGDNDARSWNTDVDAHFTGIHQPSEVDPSDDDHPGDIDGPEGFATSQPSEADASADVHWIAIDQPSEAHWSAISQPYEAPLTALKGSRIVGFGKNSRARSFGQAGRATAAIQPRQVVWKMRDI